MKQTVVILLCAFSLLSTVRAFPFGAFLIQERHVITESRQIQERQLLDALSSIAGDLSSVFDPPETTSSRTASATTKTSISDDDDLNDDTTSTSRRSTTTKTSSSRETRHTSTRTSSRSESSRSKTSSTSESTSSETTTTTATTSSSSTGSALVKTTDPTETPQPSNSNGSGPNVPAIAGGVAGAIIFLVILNAVLFWGCGPLKRWRENRSYQKMLDRSYRPALDDPKPIFPETRENGLRLHPANVMDVSSGGGKGGAAEAAAAAAAAAAAGGYHGVNLTHPTSYPATPAAAAVAAVPPQRAFSYDEHAYREQTVRRKPLPMPRSDGGGGFGALQGPSSHMVAGRDAPWTHPRVEPWLPGGPRDRTSSG